jgi:hypothetical protein
VPDEKRAEILRAQAHDYNASRIARQVGGVSRWTIGQIAKAAGINVVGRSENVENMKTPCSSAVNGGTLQHGTSESSTKASALTGRGVRSTSQYGGYVNCGLNAAFRAKRASIE